MLKKKKCFCSTTLHYDWRLPSSVFKFTSSVSSGWSLIWRADCISISADSNRSQRDPNGPSRRGIVLGFFPLFFSGLCWQMRWYHCTNQGPTGDRGVWGTYGQTGCWWAAYMSLSSLPERERAEGDEGRGWAGGGGGGLKDCHALVALFGTRRSAFQALKQKTGKRFCFSHFGGAEKTD